MRFAWFDFVAVTAFAALTCTAVCVVAVRTLRRAIAERDQEIGWQLSALTVTVKALQARVADLGAERAQAQRGAAGEVAAEDAGAKIGDQMEPQILAAISAAAAVGVGRRVRVRSAQALPAAQDNWAQQGRVIVQTSHNLPPRG